jgi:signal transduction histidine kinase
MMTANRKLTLVLAPAVCCAIAALVSFWVMDRTAQRQDRDGLAAIAKSQAQMIGAIMDADSTAGSVGRIPASLAAALGSSISIHRTGRMILGQLQGDRILLQDLSEQDGENLPGSIPLNSNFADPMRRALSGRSGAMTARDQNGNLVLAAYEPIQGRNLALVAKVDLAEIKGSYRHAGWKTAFAIFLAGIAGTALIVPIAGKAIKKPVDTPPDLTAEAIDGREADQALRSQWDRFLAAMENLPGLFYVTDLETHELLFINRGYSEALGTGPLGGKCFKEIYGYTQPCSFCTTGQLQAQQTPIAWEHCHPTFERDYFVTDQLLRQPDGRMAKLSLAVDITERKQLARGVLRADREMEAFISARTGDLKTRVEQEELLSEAMLNLADDLRIANETLHNTSRKLRAANSELESFAHTVAHDLRAPLRRVDGFCRAVIEDQGDQLDETGREYLDRASSATEKMGRLIEDILSLAKAAEGNLNKRTVDLSELAVRISEELRAEDQRSDARFVIQNDLTVMADPGLMQVVLENLLSNAWKFTSKQPSTTIEFGFESAENGSAFFVRDNGPGFDPARSTEMFGAFKRLHDQREFPGTGIGLASVKKIVHRHGGRVWANGREGHGATFYFTLSGKPVSGGSLH